MGYDTPVYKHPIPHNIPVATTHPTEFWPQNYPYHPRYASSLLHQNLLPVPNIHAFFTQYMGLNNLGIFNYPQNLGVGLRINHSMANNNNIPKESPTLLDVER